MTIFLEISILNLFLLTQNYNENAQYPLINSIQ